MNISRRTAMVLALGAAFLGSAQAIELRSGFGGTAGYGDLSQLPNDDESSSLLNLPFALNFFGTTYNNFYANNNGNVSFSGPLWSYTPDPFPIASQPMIAPYWGDVDTRNQPGGGAVYVAAPNPDTVVVTWHNVGYYSQNNTKLNDFQMTLLNRSDTGARNFDIEFRYNQLQWTTGDASGGTEGLGGTPAQAGYDAGDDQHFFILPGSRTADVLNLATTSNVSLDTPGLWTMAIRNGVTSDGSTPEAPLLPEIVNQDGFNFDFNIDLNQRIFIDPLVAVGYEYRVTSGPNILTALFPSISGDTDGFAIYSLAGAFLGTAMPGIEFDFGTGGVDGFRLEDIEAGAGLDPTDTQAFVTGLTFAGTGQVSMTQRPITIDTDGNNVPEPSSLFLLGASMLALRRIQRRRNV